MNPLRSSAVPPTEGDSHRLRVATYNIHKGVRGVGPGKRLEIHNLGLAIEALDADLVCLQEVRHFHHGEARRFQRTSFGWPAQGQADFLAPDGYEVAYRTNAKTRDGEHGNALLSRWPLGEVRHHDVSDHRFEQRGLLHVPVQWQGETVDVVVIHFGLSHTSRVRQVERLGDYLERTGRRDMPVLVAGDFNDWGERLDAPLRRHGLERAEAPAREPAARSRSMTFPSLAPVFALDRIYTRGLRCTSTFVPRGSNWARMSDHLPLVAEFERAT
ncbi:MAG TPA: endonuclease/exonuclease/phosphatase family protein [Methylibium sp.]|uniref:endonuclease/exonuclease/phosphatase family protein n=1 Tax=Methylibium sp. TaxID=2067992 RepID=UPI002DB8D398|nr:endonuclease/exonuclease/phosphatase family protein [Methylibium sp.]HEU4459244.1 endonuclease/exonuclease/phosphatase family protein [Methylibium sp.]